MRTPEELKLEVEGILRAEGDLERHLWESYAAYPECLGLLGTAGEARNKLAELLRQIVELEETGVGK